MTQPSSVRIRRATTADVSAMAECRLSDPDAGRADERMTAYFEGTYSPGEALAPRFGYVAFDDDRMVGYVAGHHTTRQGAQGEVEYLFIAPSHRRHGIATELLRHTARWFVETGATDVIVNADADSPGAVEVYLACGAERVHKYWVRWTDITAFAASTR